MISLVCVHVYLHTCLYPCVCAQRMCRYKRCNACFSHHLRVRALEHLRRLNTRVSRTIMQVRMRVRPRAEKKNVHIHFLTHIHIHIHTYTLQSRSLLPMSNAFAIVCLVTSIYAIVATSFFAGVQPDHYGSFFISFFSMFQAITGDNWWVFFSIVFAGFRLFASCTPCLPLCDSPLNLRVFNETLLFFKVSDNQKSTGLLMC